VCPSSIIFILAAVLMPSIQFVVPHKCGIRVHSHFAIAFEYPDPQSYSL